LLKLSSAIFIRKEAFAVLQSSSNLA